MDKVWCVLRFPDNTHKVVKANWTQKLFKMVELPEEYDMSFSWFISEIYDINDERCDFDAIYRYGYRKYWPEKDGEEYTGREIACLGVFVNEDNARKFAELAGSKKGKANG